jgi:hypothetical protein
MTSIQITLFIMHLHAELILLNKTLKCNFNQKLHKKEMIWDKYKI